MVQETFAATSIVEDILFIEDKPIVLKGSRQVATHGAHSDLCSSCFLCSKVFVVHKYYGAYKFGGSCKRSCNMFDLHVLPMKRQHIYLSEVKITKIHLRHQIFQEGFDSEFLEIKLLDKMNL
jgi:hypothetical protein